MYDDKYRRTAEMSFNHVTNPAKINLISPGGICNTSGLSIAFIYGFIHITRAFSFPPEALYSGRLLNYSTVIFSAFIFLQ